MTLVQRPAIDVEPLTGDCPECDGTIRSNCHEAICDDCGLIVAEDHIDRGPYWYWGRSDAEAVVHHKTTHLHTHDRGLGGTTNDRYRTMSFAAGATHGSKKSRNLGYLICRVQTITSTLDLATTTREHALLTLRRIHDARDWSGNNLDVIAAVAALVSIRQHERPVLIDEVASAAGLETDRLTNLYLDVCSQLEMAYQPANPRWFVTRFASELDITHEQTERARSMVEAAIDSGAANSRQPNIVVGGAIAVATPSGRRDDGVAQAAIAETCQASAVSIRTMAQAIEEVRGCV